MDVEISADDVSDGDLGLGDGLKPGGLPLITDFDHELNGNSPHTHRFPDKINQSTNEDSSSNSGFTTPDDSDDEFEISLMPISSIQQLKSRYAYLNLQPTKRSQETIPLPIKNDDNFYDERYIIGAKKVNNKDEDNGKVEDTTNEKFPVYADVPYGTSIRQQKELFKHNIEGLKKKMVGISGGITSDGTNNSKDSVSKRSSRKNRSEEIAMKLAETLQEVEDLKVELNTCEQRLDSKYKAIDILRLQAQEAQEEQRLRESVNRETTKKLAQVQVSDAGGGSSRVISLDEEQDLTDLTATLRMTSVTQRSRSPVNVPMKKYKRMCQDNRALMEALEVRTEELRKVTAQNMAVKRENDELLALLDVQERAKYSRTRSASSEENYCNYTSTELAVLGACRCRISNPDPCGCAIAAANMKRDIVKLKEQVQQYKNRRDEAFMTIDAYRKAFEEQLERNKCLTVQLSQISSNHGNNSPSRQSRTRRALKWLLGSLNDEELSDDSTNNSQGPLMSDAEVITYLTEMLQEKKEVLVHQKLASQILADKVRILEQQLAQRAGREGDEEEEGVFKSEDQEDQHG